MTDSTIQRASLSAVFRRFLFVRETEGPNHGAFVEMFQRFSAGKPGDAWCAFAVSFVLDIAYHGKPPFGRTGSAQVLREAAQIKGETVTFPQVDDLFFYIDAQRHAHHVGIVTGTSPLTGIAGNTSEDGLSANGTGVFEHAIPSDPARVVFVRLPMAA